MTTWRYIAQRAVTGEFLDFDVPMTRDELTWDLSGPGALRGTISPEYGRLLAPDGAPVFDEWGTLLYAEADGEIRWGGILVLSTFAGAAWQLEAAGVTTYPHGVPYEGAYTKPSVDPFDVVREIWRHVQSYPDGNLGVTVGAGSTPVRLGAPAIPAFVEVDLGDGYVPKSSVDPALIVASQSGKLKNDIDKNDTSLTLQSLAGFDAAHAPYTIAIGSEKIQVAGRSGNTLTGLTRGLGTSTATGHNAGTTVTHTGTPSRTHALTPAQPYALDWWDVVDCGEELDALAQETPFDFREVHAWDGDTVTHSIQLGYPRLGTRRFDLAFVQGDNVVSQVSPTRDGAAYGNEVVAIGAGEGSSSLRIVLPSPDGRLRRPVVYSDVSITTSQRLTALARAKLASVANVLEIGSIDVIDHPNAPIGSWQLGDDILVSADLPWLGRVDIWERVVSWSLISESRATLRLQRSDSFIYGSAS